MKITFLAPAALLTTISLATAANAENFEHTRQLLSTKQCVNCDLSGAGLVMANLPNAQLSGADLSRANLSRAQLTRANFAGADLSGTSLFGANLAGANFKGANLRGADLRQAYLSDTDLTGANLDNANLQGALGIPVAILKVEDVYNWGVAAAQRKNQRGAIDYFNQALSINPDFAPAYLARSIVLQQMGNNPAALADAKKASELFAIQNNPQAFESTQILIAQLQAVENPKKPGKGAAIVNLIGSMGVALLRLML